MYIGGRWIDAAEGNYPVRNPATEEVIALAPQGSVEEMHAAIAAARRAFDEGPWPSMAGPERGRIIRQIADRLSARRETLQQLLTAEVGSVQVLMPIQLDDPLRFLYHYADLATKTELDEMLPPIIQGGSLTQALVHRQAAGVVGAINTWNFPLFVLIQKIGPALAAGCTLVVKGAPFAPLTNLEVAKAVEETDLPRGVFNVVTGERVAASEALVASPLVDKITFTGSVPTGKRIAQAAAANLTRVHLELGGKSPCIVLDDVDIDAVLPAIASPSFVHAGQACAATTRCLVPRAMHDSVAKKMADFVGNLGVGDPADPSVLVGPLIREERRTAVEEYIESGREAGATLVTGGSRPEGLQRGYFLQPTIFGDANNDMRVAREEIFGPVLTLIPYDDVDHAIRVANDSPYGLSGRIATSDTAKAIELSKRLRTGSVLISGGLGSLAGTPFHVVPFGGFKESGLGREGGVYGLHEFTEVQSIIW
jgi:acyl-CoA reductase-like NAD-dependent aldehyde dehydrogenase